MEINNYEYVKLLLEVEFQENTIIKYYNHLNTLKILCNYFSIRTMFIKLLNDRRLAINKMLIALSKKPNLKTKIYGNAIIVMLNEMLNNASYYDGDDEIIFELENTIDEVRRSFRSKDIFFT